MIIRKPIERDIEGLIKLSNEFSNESDWGDKIPIGQINTQEIARKWLFGENIVKVLVTEITDEIVGYVCVRKYDEVYETSILINSNYRGKGIGKAMIDKLFSLISKDIEVEAWVADFNEVSLNVTPKLGFEFKKKLFEKDFIPGKEFYVHIFTRKGEKGD